MIDLTEPRWVNTFAFFGLVTAIGVALHRRWCSRPSPLVHRHRVRAVFSPAGDLLRPDVHPHDGFSGLRFSVRRKLGWAHSQLVPVELCFHRGWRPPPAGLSLHFQDNGTLAWYSSPPELPTPSPPDYIVFCDTIELFPAASDDDSEVDLDPHPEAPAANGSSSHPPSSPGHLWSTAWAWVALGLLVFSLSALALATCALIGFRDVAYKVPTTVLPSFHAEWLDLVRVYIDIPLPVLFLSKDVHFDLESGALVTSTGEAPSMLRRNAATQNLSSAIEGLKKDVRRLLALPKHMRGRQLFGGDAAANPADSTRIRDAFDMARDRLWDLGDASAQAIIELRYWPASAVQVLESQVLELRREVMPLLPELQLDEADTPQTNETAPWRLLSGGGFAPPVPSFWFPGEYKHRPLSGAASALIHVTLKYGAQLGEVACNFCKDNPAYPACAPGTVAHFHFPLADEAKADTASSQSGQRGEQGEVGEDAWKLTDDSVPRLFSLLQALDGVIDATDRLLATALTLLPLDSRAEHARAITIALGGIRNQRDVVQAAVSKLNGVCRDAKALQSRGARMLKAGRLRGPFVLPDPRVVGRDISLLGVGVRRCSKTLEGLED